MGCTAVNCKNRHSKNSGLQFFRFPLNDPHRLKQWENNMRRCNWTPYKCDRLCSEHFERDCFTTVPLGQSRRLKKTAVPTIFYHTRFKPKPRKRYSHKSTQTIATDTESTLEQADQQHDTAVTVNMCANVDVDRTIQAENPGGKPSDHCCPLSEEPFTRVSDHNYVMTESPASMKSKCEKLKDRVFTARRQLRSRDKSMQRLKPLLTGLKQEVKLLKKRLMISNQCADIYTSLVNNGDAIPLEIFKGMARKTRLFSEKLRRFSATLFEDSPRAYEIVREKFKMALPAPSAVRRNYLAKVPEKASVNNINL